VFPKIGFILGPSPLIERHDKVDAEMFLPMLHCNTGGNNVSKKEKESRYKV